MKYVWRLVYFVFFLIFIVPLCMACAIHGFLDWFIDGLCSVEDNLVERM